MEARLSRRVLVNAALLAAVLAYPALLCAPLDGGQHERVMADTPSPDKNKSERCKRAEGARNPPKGCPDGGERLPQDRRSPLDTIPPLSPLVA